MRIAKEQILRGIENGTVRFETDPNMECGTVARIGDRWLYFGGSDAEEKSPEEYLSHTSREKAADEIFQALSDFEAENPDEIVYYEAVLSESFGKAEILRRKRLSDGVERLLVRFEGKDEEAVVVRGERGEAEVFRKTGSADDSFRRGVLDGIEAAPNAEVFLYRDGSPVRENDRISVRVREKGTERFEKGTFRLDASGNPYLELCNGSESDVLGTARRLGLCFEIRRE